MIVITKKGMSIRFATNDIAAIGRTTSGVKAIKLSEGRWSISRITNKR